MDEVNEKKNKLDEVNEKKEEKSLQNDENILDILINENVNFGWEHFKVVLIMIILLIGEGFVMTVNSLIIPVISQPWYLTQFHKGLAGGGIFIGFTLGALCAGLVSDYKGRKSAFLVGSIISASGGLIVFITYGIYSLTLSNILIGYGFGISIPSIVSLCSEITNSKERTIIIGLVWISFVFGEILGSYIAMNLEVYQYENFNWKKLLLFRCAFFYAIIPLIFTLYESPKFLLSKGGEEYSDKAFSFISIILNEESKHLLTDDLKIKIIDQYTSFMNQSDMIKRNCYKDLVNSKNIGLSLSLFILWYMVTYIYYGLIYILPSVYEKLALTEHKSNLVDANSYNEIISEIIISCVLELPTMTLSGFLPNIIGRKSTIMIGFIGSLIFSTLCCIGTFSIPFYSSMIKSSINLSFNVLYIYTSEIYPTYMRSTAIGCSNFFARLGGLTTPFVNQILFSKSIKFPFILFGLASSFGIIITSLLEETFGKTNF